MVGTYFLFIFLKTKNNLKFYLKYNNSYKFIFKRY